MLNLNCACGAIRTFFFDHVRGTVTSNCPRCKDSNTA
jgi:hypothetical protein